MTLLGHGHKSAEQQEEIREAKRLLNEKVRSDWDYPALPAYRIPPRRQTPDDTENGAAGIGGFRLAPSHSYDSEGPLEPEVVEWQDREYSTESDSEEEGVQSAHSGEAAERHYRFEDPDSVGEQITDRRLARKRKRQKELEEEMSWNEGLAHWMRRRDVWSGARTAAQIKALERQQRPQRHQEDAHASASVSTNSTPRTSVSSTGDASARSTVTTPELPPLPPHAAPASAAAPQSEVLVPVAAPILPNHPIRQRISPSMYNEIYTKIILQSRTPSVPINLLTVIAALIHGWKNDGEWPPKPGLAEPSIGKRRLAKESTGGESGFKHGVMAVGRALHLTHAGGVTRTEG